MLPPSLISFCQYCHFHSYSSHSWLSDICDNLTASPLAYTLQWLPVLGEEASIQRATVPSQPGLAHLSSLISSHSSPNDKSSAIFCHFPNTVCCSSPWNLCLCSSLCLECPLLTPFEFPLGYLLTIIGDSNKGTWNKDILSLWRLKTTSPWPKVITLFTK